MIVRAQPGAAINVRVDLTNPAAGADPRSSNSARDKPPKFRIPSSFGQELVQNLEEQLGVFTSPRPLSSRSQPETLSLE